MNALSASAFSASIYQFRIKTCFVLKMNSSMVDSAH